LRDLKALNFSGKHNLAFGFNRSERSEIWKTFLGASDGPYSRHAACGRARADNWLTANFDDPGARSTVDIRAKYL
jgi:hypothetical protein